MRPHRKLVVMRRRRARSVSHCSNLSKARVRLTSDDGRTRLCDVSDRSATSNLGKLSGVQDVPGIHGETLGQLMGPQSTGDGVTDSSSDTGPERKQGDSGTHVSVRNSGLNGDLGSDDRASTLNDNRKIVIRRAEQHKLMPSPLLTPIPTKI
jgi:hypothetical protein